MHLLQWIVAAGLIRFLPLCTASPIAAPQANPVAATASQNATSDACRTMSTAGTSADCWTILKMEDFYANWTEHSVMAGAPMIGTIFCRPNELWAQCFIRFAYGQHQKTGAPMDCSSPSSTSCSSPAAMIIKPTSPEYWYGVHAIYAIFTYITTLISALLTTTGRPGALQSIYTSANAGAGASASPNPVDASLLRLLSQDPISNQDIFFAAYLKRQPSAGNFVGATTDPPSDKILYEGLVEELRSRLTKVMSSWAEFQSVLAPGQIWMEAVQGSAQFVEKWTATAPSATAPETATS
ncbi:MAG: hypothetical protein Q9172_001125 [Xanthocarpia lactea]